MERSFLRQGRRTATRFSGPRREGTLREHQRTDLPPRPGFPDPPEGYRSRPGSARRSSPASRCATSSKNASRRGLYGWTLCTLPTPELAAQARTTPELYTEQIIRACYLDRRDPVGEWETIRQNATAIKQWLSGLKAAFLHIESERCDLRITPGARRKWAGVSGHNIPSFELFVSPDWRGTEGTYYGESPLLPERQLRRGGASDLRQGESPSRSARRRARRSPSSNSGWTAERRGSANSP